MPRFESCKCCDKCKYVKIMSWHVSGHVDSISILLGQESRVKCQEGISYFHSRTVASGVLPGMTVVRTGPTVRHAIIAEFIDGIADLCVGARDRLCHHSISSRSVPSGHHSEYQIIMYKRSSPSLNTPRLRALLSTYNGHRPLFALSERA